MNYEYIGKPLRKESNPKNRKETVKIEVKMPHMNNRSLARKRIFVQAPFFSLYFEISVKKYHPKTTRFFAPLPDSV